MQEWIHTASLIPPRSDPRFQSLLGRMNFPEQALALTWLRAGRRMRFTPSPARGELFLLAGRAALFLSNVGPCKPLQGSERGAE
jgi:hypothetical protein